MVMDLCCQSTSPEILGAASTPSMSTLRKSKLASESTFHQNDTVAGPVTVVSRRLLWPSAIAPLLAASAPSWLTWVCGVQPASPPVDHCRSGSSRAAVSVFGGGGGGGVTVSTAASLVTVPAE